MNTIKIRIKKPLAQFMSSETFDVGTIVDVINNHYYTRAIIEEYAELVVDTIQPVDTKESKKGGK